MSALVIDASVGIKLFVDEAGSDAAHELIGGALRKPDVQLLVPDLFFVECANILWKYAWRFGYPHELVARDIEDLPWLGMAGVPTRDLVASATPLALRTGVSVYDACYVTLAREARGRLVTADARLAQAMKGERVDIVVLS